MKCRDPGDSSAEQIRAHALASAISLRDCSLRAEISWATRRACRSLMRAQANAWRRPLGGNGSPASR